MISERDPIPKPEVRLQNTHRFKEFKFFHVDIARGTGEYFVFVNDRRELQFRGLYLDFLVPDSLPGFRKYSFKGAN